ncbi:response regulator [Oscillatoria sp. FACHB-1407]|uniref:ATP-binding protein n=1 Tax=Oscillatoria sp. FACHB-1407 TaxID=2692847 RepID=UPI00168541F1|nr:ATP-binding protein [Oscillatoria sp. FACHB-1407]MBD2465747.1 response regulator [Oscillatoria sp. FACHB-1407]
MTGSVQDKAVNSIFANRGAMGELMESLDWSQTPVGSVQSWSQSLKSLVKTLLTSRYPMVLTWGGEFTQFYNDAYSQLIGDKHPAALGTDIRETLAEAWDTLGPMIQRVMATGVANWTPALPLVLERAGYREESYFSVSHAPAEDDDGQIVGMLAVCSEVTQQVLGERRLRLLRDLAAQTGETRSVQDTCQDLMMAIAAHPLDVPFALLYLREPDGRTLTLQGTVGLTVDDQLCPHSIDLATASATTRPLWSFASVVTGETVLAEALDQHMIVSGGPWNEPVHTALMMPIASSGKAATLGVLVAGVNPNRALDEGYRSFYELLVGQVSVSIRNAQAYEEERRRAEMLAELDRAKTAFFSNVSHEFRTPLTLMLNPLKEVLQSNQLPLAEREKITIAQRNAQRLLKLVNTLLDFSRIEAGRAQAYLEPTDLAAYTVELTSLFQSAIEQAGLRLIVDCPPLPQPVSVDRDMWEKIVLNLLSNAFKFTFKGEIRVSLRVEERESGGVEEYSSAPLPLYPCVILEVQDTGTGIPTADLPRLFERFHRVAGAQGRTFEGTGIGLSLVQELVHLHNGAIAVESTLGQGSTFRVQLPMNPTTTVAGHSVGIASALENHYRDNQTQPADSAALYVQEASSWLPEDVSRGVEERRSEQVQSPSPPLLLSPFASDSSPARIFLIDDNADMRNYLHRILSKFYQVEVFTEGSAALDAARAVTPDLVLSDVMMPGMDGFELLKQLRRDPQTREIPILLLSARAGEEAAVEGLNAGADDYLVKPFSARELLARVAVNVELGRSRQAAARRRLDQVLSSVSDFIYTFDLAGRFTYANQPLLDLWQKPLAEIVGKNFFDLDYPPDLADRLQQQIQHVITTRQPLKDETPYTSASGTSFYEYIFVPLIDTDGAVEAVAGTGRDISDRKRAEAALRESEQQFRTLTTTIPQLIWTATPDGNVDYLSQQWVDYIGLPPEQLYDWQWQDVVHPEDLPNTVRDWGRSLETGEPVDIKHRFRFRTGEWRWQLVRGTPIKDETGQVTKWVGTCTDIQSEIDAQAIIQATNDRLKLLSEMTNELLLNENPQSFLSTLFQKLSAHLNLEIYVNYLLQEDRQRLRLIAHSGLSTEVASAVEFLDLGQAVCGYVVQQREAAVIEHALESSSFLAAPLQTIGIRAYASYPLMVNHQAIGTLGFGTRIRDRFLPEELELMQTVCDQVSTALQRSRLIKALQQRAEELAQANRIKDEFLAVLSHELRSPLNPILGWTQLLQSGKLDAVRQSEALNTIERNAKLQTQLIEDLLDISRIMQGKLSLTVAPVSLTFVISAALETVRLAAEAKNIGIILNLAPEVASVSGDAARLQQVVWNLLSNAVKFTPRGGQVTVELKQMGQLAQIRVIDTGKGINPQFLPHMFEYFRQEDGSTTRKFGGLGLGLAIARQIVEMHGGTVWAESQGEGQGATFILQLPLLESRASGIESRENPPGFPLSTPHSPLTGLHILLVDDELDTREFQAFVLKQGGAKVTAVASAFEALQTLNQFTPDILVSDIGMPGMDGYMLMQQIRSRLSNQGKTTSKGDLLLKAIALTAYAAEVDQQRALQAGFQAHLTKPVEPETLVQTIARLCGG